MQQCRLHWRIWVSYLLAQAAWVSSMAPILMWLERPSVHLCVLIMPSSECTLHCTWVKQHHRLCPKADGTTCSRRPKDCSVGY
jgi:hypothetical protein